MLWAALLPTLFPEFSSETPVLPHSAKPRLLSMIPSCLQNQYHLGDLHCQALLPAWGTSFRNTVSTCLHEETLSRRLHLNDPSLFLITANFSASVIVAKQRFHFSSSGILLLTATDSLFWLISVFVCLGFFLFVCFFETGFHCVTTFAVLELPL